MAVKLPGDPKGWGSTRTHRRDTDGKPWCKLSTFSAQGKLTDDEAKVDCAYCKKGQRRVPSYRHIYHWRGADNGPICNHRGFTQLYAEAKEQVDCRYCVAQLKKLVRAERIARMHARGVET